MAAKRVAAQQDDVDGENQGAKPKTEFLLASGRIDEPQRLPNVVSQNQKENEREIEQVPVNVLEDKREGALTQIGFAWLTDHTRGRVGPECFVVRPAIVITGEPE